MLKDIKDLTWTQTLGGLFGFTGAIAPGFLLIYLYKPELLSSLDTLKVIFFSLSLSLPIIIVNLFLQFNILDEDGEEFEIAVISLFMSSLVSYPSILISYLFLLSFKEFLIVLAIAQIVVFILFIFIKKVEEKNKNA